MVVTNNGRCCTAMAAKVQDKEGVEEDEEGPPPPTQLPTKFVSLNGGGVCVTMSTAAAEDKFHQITSPFSVEALLAAAEMEEELAHGAI